MFIRFKDLILNPVEQIGLVYEHLSLPFEATMQQRVQKFLLDYNTAEHSTSYDIETVCYPVRDGARALLRCARRWGGGAGSKNYPSCGKAFLQGRGMDITNKTAFSLRLLKYLARLSWARNLYSLARTRRVAASALLLGRENALNRMGMHRR